MRLIDADRLKDEVVKWLSTDDGIEQRDLVGIDDIAASVMQTIDEQPTAYDIDKVVEEIQEASTYDACWDDGGYSVDVEDAIYIVKRGGVDD